MTDTITQQMTEAFRLNRLDQLPPKAAEPFRQLLRTGQISPDIVATVLDAGELSGESTKLIGFAAAYLHLRSKNIPVHDVIRMAKEQNTRLNLAWSPNRWQDQHDKLSRAEALRRLASESIAYDVSKFEDHLPAVFPGYLIRTSRRLGMEGLRQRHCVANYHDRLLKGACAIAAVFVDKQRWTVQLEIRDDALCITQIKSRHNTLPPAALRRRIHDLLGVKLPEPGSVTAIDSDNRELYMENLRRILPILREHGIERVVASFDGGGDSGSIHDIAYVPDANAPSVIAQTLEYLSTSSFYEEDRWQNAVAPLQGSVNDVIDALTYDYLEEVDVDWYNNDGGYGELIIDVSNGTVSLEVNQRYTESNTEYSMEHDIETGKAI